VRFDLKPILHAREAVGKQQVIWGAIASKMTERADVSGFEGNRRRVEGGCRELTGGRRITHGGPCNLEVGGERVVGEEKE
jgi:hypothetical protein